MERRLSFQRPQQQQTYFVSCLTTCRLSTIRYYQLLDRRTASCSSILYVNRTRFTKMLYPYISVYHISMCVSSCTYICLYFSVSALQRQCISVDRQWTFEIQFFYKCTLYHVQCTYFRIYVEFLIFVSHLRISIEHPCNLHIQNRIIEQNNVYLSSVISLQEYVSNKTFNYCIVVIWHSEFCQT